MDFIPRQRAERILWLQGISKLVEEEGAKMGVPPEEALSAKALADDQLAKYAATNAAESALAGERRIEMAGEVVNLAGLRKFFRHWKTLPGYPLSGSGGTLRLTVTAARPAPATLRPKITAREQNGVIRIDYKKRGMDAVAVYCRLRGEVQWVRLGVDRESPFIDTRPVAVPGVAEVREYMARPMIGDEEVGQESSIVEITLRG